MIKPTDVAKIRTGDIGSKTTSSAQPVGPVIKRRQKNTKTITVAKGEAAQIAPLTHSV